jgi:hypothetical protein
MSGADGHVSAQRFSAFPRMTVFQKILCREVQLTRVDLGEFSSGLVRLKAIVAEYQNQNDTNI